MRNKINWRGTQIHICITMKNMDICTTLCMEIFLRTKVHISILIFKILILIFFNYTFILTCLQVSNSTYVSNIASLKSEKKEEG
jgi:hypothetical protein